MLQLTRLVISKATARKKKQNTYSYSTDPYMCHVSPRKFRTLPDSSSLSFNIL